MGMESVDGCVSGVSVIDIYVSEYRAADNGEAQTSVGSAIGHKVGARYIPETGIASTDNQCVGPSENISRT